MVSNMYNSYLSIVVGVLIFLERTQEIPRHKGFLEVYRFGEKAVHFNVVGRRKNVDVLGVGFNSVTFFGPALTSYHIPPPTNCHSGIHFMFYLS